MDRERRLIESHYFVCCVASYNHCLSNEERRSKIHLVSADIISAGNSLQSRGRKRKFWRIINSQALDSSSTHLLLSYSPYSLRTNMEKIQSSGEGLESTQILHSRFHSGQIHLNVTLTQTRYKSKHYVVPQNPHPSWLSLIFPLFQLHEFSSPLKYICLHESTF